MTPRLRRLSRRTLLTDFGAAGFGLIVLGSCAGSSESGSSAGSATQPSDPTDTTPVTERADGALQLQHVPLGIVSAYILARGGEAAIVDTGRAGSRDAILEGLDALSVTPSAVRHVVLTHDHGDHIGGLSGLEADLSAATVYAGAGDIASIRSSLRLVEVGDGDEVFGMGVVETPGHTPGSISLFDTRSGILVAGDAVNGDGNGGLTGANPDFSSDMDAAARSVATLAALMPSTVAFGHGGAPVDENAAAKLDALT